MIKIQNKILCCGCEACVQVCPQKCIEFKQDKYGFFYPSVKEDECVNCNLCNKICPILNIKDYKLPNDTNTYAAYNPNNKQRESSSSGGIFISLAEKIIEKKEIIFAACFDDNWNVIHSYTDKIYDLEKFKRSKYVQSRIGNTFITIQEFLKSNRMVLFVGTPCQVAGLKGFLRKEYPNLITVDVICHGVPSSKIWLKYLREQKIYFSRKNNCGDIKLIDISFRDKKISWHQFNLTIKYMVGDEELNKKIKTYSASQQQDYYMRSFSHDYIIRPSCFRCKFRNGKCKSDITLADFWGIEKITCEQNYIGEEGTTMILSHNSKSEKLLSELSIHKIPLPFKDSISGNPAIIKDWPKPIMYSFYNLLIQYISIKWSITLTETIESIIKGIRIQLRRTKKNILKK